MQSAPSYDRPKTEGGQARQDVPGAKHSCVESKCSIRNCNIFRQHLLDTGRITDVGDGQYQSNITAAYEEFDPIAMEHVAEILGEGARVYGSQAYLKRSVRHHLGHAIRHLYWHLREGSEGESHLGNAVCRAMFALSVYLRERSEGIKHGQSD